MKLGILGAGNIAGCMARTIREMKEVQGWAVASRDLRKAQKFAQEYGIEKAYGSYEELVKDPEVDLIYIATPHSHHYQHMKLCLEHRKPVLCEKAFTQNAAQAREILDQAEEQGIFVTEAIWTRYMPMRRKLDEILESGVIGKPHSLYAELSYPVIDKQRIWDPALAGGALLDIGVYPLNFASMAFGDDLERIEASAVLTDKGVDAVDNLVLTYRDGRTALLHSDARTAGDRSGIIYGEEGYVVCQNINNCEAIRVFEKDHRMTAEYLTPRQITGYEYELETCMEALKNGWLECPQMPHSETLLIMDRMDEIRRMIGVKYPNE